MTTDKEISQEVDALLRFYGGRKLISKKDIYEFSRVYKIAQLFVPEPIKE